MDWVKPVISALMFSPLFEFEKNNSILNKPAREDYPANENLFKNNK
jgi:hypothetical protein